MAVRFLALDRLRAVAVLAMVQGHTFTALLREGAMPRAWAQLHALFHGLTAPAFLFGAGLAFGIASYPPDPELREVHARSGSRLRRYASIFALGYLLQLPGGSLLAALRLRGEALVPVLRVGPLQLIAVCLSVCQLLTIVRSRRTQASVCGALGLSIAASAPAVYASSLSSAAPAWLGGFIDDRTGSLFPLFPWASFVFVGVAAAYPLARAGTRPAPWLAAGVLVTATTYALYRAGYRLSEPQHFWQASPLNMAFRLGLVSCLLGTLHLSASPAPLVAAQRTWTALLARHSLVAYVAHLLLLYGTPLTPSLVRYHARKLELVETSAVFVLVLSATLLAVYAWSRLHEPRRQPRPWVKLVVVGCGVLLLVR